VIHRRFEEPRAGSSSKWQLLASWAASFIYIGIIFFFSAQSSPSLPYGFSGGEFFLHMAEYGVLGFLLSWAFVNSGIVRNIVFRVFMVGLIYGMFDELHQYFVPQRDASLLDVSADGIGCLIGAYSFHVLRSIKLKLVVPHV